MILKELRRPTQSGGPRVEAKFVSISAASLLCLFANVIEKNSQLSISLSLKFGRPTDMSALWRYIEVRGSTTGLVVFEYVLGIY